MNRPDDRVAIPTNGHRAKLHDEDGDIDLAETTDLGSGRPNLAFPGSRAPLPPASPGQVAVGFGILAALILVILGRRRGQRG